ncbi:MAG: methyltransferase domain-containing protein [Akkermansiaceae bacterium]|nr:methyltransferase domain-containing protein [Akkermansiaceae bacterium]
MSTQHGLTNLEYRIGDIEEPPMDSSSLDLAILSQALHHAERPQRAIDAAFRILKSDGCLIVLDLVQHNFEEARELYADRWLGFSESELAGMLEKSGFQQIEIIVADREELPPKFQTLLAVAIVPDR